MQSVTSRHAITAAVASLGIATAGPAVLAAQAASASPSTPASSASTRGLLDGVLGTLTTLLNPTALNSLSTLTTQLTSGLPATPAQLSGLTSLLQGLGSTQPDASLVASLLGGTGSDPVNAAFLGRAQALLGQLAALQGLNPTDAATLAGLQTAIQNLIASTPLGSAAAGMPIGAGSLSLGNNPLDGLTALLTQLTNGSGASGTAFDSVVAILRDAASKLPAPLGTVVTQVADQLDALVGPLTDALLPQVSGLLMSIAATNGVSGTPIAGLLAQLAGVLNRSSVAGTGTGTGTGTGSGTSTTTNKPGTTTTGTVGTTNATGTGGGGVATKNATGSAGGSTAGSGGATAGKAAPRIKSAKWVKAKKAFSVTFSCPTGGPACVAIVAFVRNSTAASAVTPVVLAPGASTTRTIKLNSASKALLKRKAVSFTLTSVTSKTQIATKSVKAAKTAVEKKKVKKPAKRSRRR